VGIAFEGGIAEHIGNLLGRGSNRAFAIDRALVRSSASAPTRRAFA
jgi:hypothetical protein